MLPLLKVFFTRMIREFDRIEEFLHPFCESMQEMVLNSVYKQRDKTLNTAKRASMA